MALVNMAGWLAEHGARTGIPVEPTTTAGEPVPPQIDPAIVAHIQQLEATITQQADLIVKLQHALRTEIAQKQQATVAKMSGPRTGRVKRPPRAPPTPERK
jgi:hypothetical protein